MAKIQITYNATEEIDKIVEIVGEFIEMDEDLPKVKTTIQEMFQTAFDEGRKFQKVSVKNIDSL